MRGDEGVWYCREKDCETLTPDKHRCWQLNTLIHTSASFLSEQTVCIQCSRRERCQSLEILLTSALSPLDIAHSSEKRQISFSQDQDADQTRKVYQTVRQCTHKCVYVCITCAILHITQQVFDVIDAIGLDPLFHRHQINRQRINSALSEQWHKGTQIGSVY